MSSVARLWFGVAIALVAFLSLLQARAAYLWASSPWLGMTVLDTGRISLRSAAEAPADLQPLLALEPVVTAISRGERWHDLGDLPGEQSSRPGVQRWLSRWPEGTRFWLRLAVPGLSLPLEVAVDSRRVPGSIVLERFGLAAGMALVTALAGLLVFRARPDSLPALAFSVMSVVLGIELLTAQLPGGFPSRYHWLSILAAYAVPPAAATLALTLEPRPWLARRKWLPWLPWALGLGAALAADLHGSLLDDRSPVLRLSRLLAWVFVLVYLGWARLTSRSRTASRRLELYLAGMALAFAPPLYACSLTAPPPWLMLSLLAFPVLIGYGVLEHRRFDLGLAFRRGVAYTLLALVAAGSSALGLTLYTRAHGPDPLPRAPLVGGVLVGIGLLAGWALRTRLLRVVDRGLHPARFRELQALRQARAELASGAAEPALAERLVMLATELAGLGGAAVCAKRPGGFRVVARAGRIATDTGALLGEREPLVALASRVSSDLDRLDFEQDPRLETLRAPCLERMDELGIDVVLPIRKRRGIAGLLLLAPRPDGEPLASEVLDLLRALASKAASALGRSSADPVAASQEDSRPSAPVVPAAGVRIGRYLLTQELGAGDRGARFLATDERLGRQVALKFLSQEPFRQLESLRREARLIASMSHAHIELVHGLEEEAGQTFLCVEHIDGPTLAEELGRRDGFSLGETVAVGSVLSDALGYAQARGVVHGDVRLQNVRRTSAGVVKLCDFGLAEPISPGASLTDPSRGVGTLAYLAPELLHGRPASYASDMFALGILLLKLITGRGATSPGAPKRVAMLLGATSVRALESRGVPAALIPVLARLLRADPAERYPDYETLARDLRAAGRKA